MDSESLEFTRPGGLLRRRSLLVWDAFRAHLAEPVKRALCQTNTDVIVIPDGLTSVLQPLDVCLSKPFKDRVRERWTTWMVEGEKSLTPAGNVKAASLTTVASWVLETWRDLPDEMVARSFKKCGTLLTAQKMTCCGKKRKILFQTKRVKARKVKMKTLMMIASHKKSGKTCLARVMMRTTLTAFIKQGLCLLTKQLL